MQSKIFSGSKKTMFGLFTSTMAMLLVTIHYQDRVEVILRSFWGRYERPIIVVFIHGDS